MSDAERQRRLHVENRLAELDWALGRDRGPPLESVACEPSWGSVGSLARGRLQADDYDALARRDFDMAALERQRQPVGEESSVHAPVAAAPEDVATPIWVV